MVNRIDKFTQSDRKNQIYSDFLTDLNPHPVSKDIVRFVNENAVIRSIKNLIATDKGERLYQPNLGSDINRLLFEPMGQGIADMISTAVQQTITTHEPRARVLRVTTLADMDAGRYIVTVTIMVINKQEPISFNVALTRVR